MTLSRRRSFVASVVMTAALLAGCGGSQGSHGAPAASRAAVAVTGTPLFGTLHTPNNRPISDWEDGIRQYFGIPAANDIIDFDATSDLQAAFNAGIGYGTPYAVFGQVSYAIYYAKAGDPEYPVADLGGSVRTCPLDPPGTGVRIPVGAKRWDTYANPPGPVSVNPATPGDTDIHFTIIDVERNRVYGFYSYGGDTLGVVGGQFRSSTRACDQLHGDDAVIAAASTYDKRYGCTGGAGYPEAGCGLSGLGAGVSASASFGNGDSNGYHGPHGVIMPQDFDDSSWGGQAVGTLHHALRCSAPVAFQYGYMWPMQNPMGGSSGRSFRDGQIIRLDPAYDVEGSSASAAEKRVMRTLQRYGCVLSDYGTYGMALFALSAWDGVGPARGSNPWTAAAGANAEAQSFYSNVNPQGVRFGVAIPTSRLQVILPHGAAYPGVSAPGTEPAAVTPAPTPATATPAPIPAATPVATAPSAPTSTASALPPATSAGGTPGTTPPSSGLPAAPAATWTPPSDPVSPGAPSTPVVQPVGDQVVGPSFTRVRFGWAASTSAVGAALQYRVEASHTADFAQVAYDSNWTAGTWVAGVLFTGIDEEPARYYWRVLAFEPATGLYSGWSQPEMFHLYQMAE